MARVATRNAEGSIRARLRGMITGKAAHTSSWLSGLDRYRLGTIYTDAYQYGGLASGYCFGLCLGGVYETTFGGREKNKHAGKKLDTGRGTVGKTAVVGSSTGTAATSTPRSAEARTRRPCAASSNGSRNRVRLVYTDDATAYVGMKDRHHESVRHSFGGVRARQGPSTGPRASWATMERGVHGRLPQDEPGAPAPLRLRVRGAAQNQGTVTPSSRCATWSPTWSASG